MRRVFVDTTVATLAIGGPHPARDACAWILRAAVARSAEVHLSVEAIQETLFHRMRRTDRADAMASARELMWTCRVHDFDLSVLRRSLDLVEQADVRGRDAVHAATALEHGFTSIVSVDADFDEIPGLVRIDPRELEL